MAEELPPAPLPTSGFKDGDKVADKNGRVYEYVEDTNSWIDIGVLHDPQTVTKDRDGLITPTIYRKLKLIETLIKNKGVSFESFKISTKDNIKPYFYYFNSSDGLIKFTPEAVNKLRIEVDRGVLLSKIATFCCVGPKGEKGEDGEAGDDGKPAANEPKYNAVIDSSGNIQIDANVTTPIDTEISLRLFNGNNEKLVEILFKDAITSIEATDGVVVESTNTTLTYDKNLNKLSGTLSVLFDDNIDIAGLYYKARQKGPKGKKGKDGTGFIEVIEDVYGDSGVRSSEAIIAIRKSGVSDNISYTTQELFTKNVVASVTGSPNLPIGDLLESKYVGAQVTTDDCKDLNTFKFKEPELKIPDLNLPSWTPACNCTDTARYQIQRMDWGMKAAEKLPFSIVQEAPPPEACCQEDFYWCPNLGDLCTIGGSPEAPLREPVKSEFISGGDGKKGSGSSVGTSTTPDTPPFKSGFAPCLLPDPNAILLSNGGGANLGTLLENGQIVTESVVTNRGHPDIYTINLGFAAAQTEFQILVEVQIGTSDGTFNGGTPFSNSDDIEPNCILSSSFFLQTETGTITQVVPGLTQDTLHDGVQSVKSRIFTGLTVNNNTNLVLTININNTLLDCCLPYAIRTTLTSSLKSSDDGAGGSGSGSGGAGTGDGDNDDDIQNPPSDVPAENSPIVPPEEPEEVPPEFVSLPEFGDENFFLSPDRDIPLSPDRAYRPPVKEPILVPLREQLDQLYIGETLRSISINATLNVSNRIRVEILNADVSPDKYSITFPIDPHDPTINNVDWNPTSYLEFERAGSYLPNGPLGSGWYFKQASPFTINTKLTRLNVTARSDTFTNGFMFISGDEFNTSAPSELVIIAYDTAWNVNQFANKVTGYGSKWIKTVNDGVELPGDGIYQLLMQTNESIIQAIFQGIRKEFNKAFSSVIYLPNGCAKVDIIQTIDGMIDSFVGGRCEEASEPITPIQTATISFVPTFSDIQEDDPSMAFTMNVVVTTSDGLPLENNVSVVISDTGTGTAVNGVNYTFSDDIITWAAGTPSGTPASRIINIINNASAIDNTVIISLSGATNATIVDDTFTLTIMYNQTITIAWLVPAATQPSDLPQSYSINIIVTTNDGLPLEVTASADVNDVAVTLVEGIDYNYANPETVTFMSGLPSGSTTAILTSILGAGNPGYTNFTLSNPVGCSASGTFVLTLDPGGDA